MDQEACNYNADAEIDNQSCLYADLNYDCDGNCIATGINFDENGLDCAGECGGLANEDDCDVCNDDATNTK